MRILVTLLATLVTTGALAQDEGAPPMPDPGDDYPYCIDDEEIEYSTQRAYGRAWVYHPANDDDCTGFPPGETFPLVLISRGNGFSSYDYDYLASYLAHNGFVVAMVWQTNDVQDSNLVANNLLSFLSVIHLWPDFNKLDGRLALVGHSRGGEGVVRTAQRFWSEGWSGDMRAVVDLAGTDEESLHAITQQIPALLVMTASRDSDVAGRHLTGVEPASGEGTGFALYDRSPVTRAHVHIHGGIHHGFSEKLAMVGYDPYIDLADQRTITATYVNAWLRWHVLGHPYRDLFTQDYTSAVVEGTGVQLSHQFDDVPNALPITRFDFEWNQLSALSWTGVYARVTPLYTYEGYTGAYPYSSPHDSRGMGVAWDSAGSVQFDLSTTDASAYDALSFRVGRVYDSIYETGGDLGFTIEVYDQSGGVGAVQLIDWATVPPAEEFLIPGTPEGQGPSPGDNHSKSPMQTVRIDLDAFGIDTTEVDRIKFVFDGASPGEITIDDLTFTD